MPTGQYSAVSGPDKQSSNTITYTFLTSVPNYYPVTVPGGLQIDPNAAMRFFAAFTEPQRLWTQQALAAWENVANIKFVNQPQTTAGDGSSVGDITFGRYLFPSTLNLDGLSKRNVSDPFGRSSLVAPLVALV